MGGTGRAPENALPPANQSGRMPQGRPQDTPSTPSSPVSRACCGIASGLLAPVIIAACGASALAMGIYNAVLKHQDTTNPTENSYYSAGAAIGLVAGTLTLGLAACLAKNQLANTRANNTVQNAPPARPDSPTTPTTPMPCRSYTVVTQPNQEIALAVRTESPQQRETP